MSRILSRSGGLQGTRRPTTRTSDCATKASHPFRKRYGVVARERDVLPAERRDVADQFGRNVMAAPCEVGERRSQIPGVPENDRRDDEIEA